MTRKTISDALDGISMDYIAQCETYARTLPSEKEHNMGRYEHPRTLTGRKIAVLILAACLVLALGLTAYAAGWLPNWIANWVNGFQYETPTDELRESQPDHAEWLDEQLENQAILAEMAENAQTANEQKFPEGLTDASITLLESCYDGEKFVMACRFDKTQRHVTYDFDETHPLFAELRSPQEDSYDWEENWEWSVPLEEDRKQIQAKLQSDGHVGFTTYDFFISDHVLVNDEDPGFSHTNPDDNDGIFYVDPFYTSVFGSDLPESCRSLPKLDVTFIIRCIETHYWLTNTTTQWAAGDRIDYPVTFTIPNINP